MRHSGMYVIDVFTRRNEGSYRANTWASAIEALFNEGTVFGQPEVNIHVVRCGRLAAREEADVYWMPVSIEYYCYLRN